VKLSKLFLSLCILCQVAIVNAEELSVGQVQKFISISGLAASIDTMPEQFQQQINLQALTQDDKLSIEKARQAITSALAATNGYQIAESYLLSRTDAKNLINTIAFLESPLGQQIVAAEAEANAPEFPVAIQSYSLELANTPPTSERAKLVKELNKTLKSEDTVVDMLKTMTLVTADFFEGMEPDAAGEVRAAMESEWSNVEPMIRAQMSQYVVLASYYLYKDINDQQLSQYISFLKSQDGQVYSEATIEIFQRYVNQLVNAMLKNIIADTAAGA